MMRNSARRGMTLIELLVVMVIMAILMAFVANVLIGVGSEARIKKTLADISKISLALTEYKNYFGEYPPDTGYGLQMEGARPEIDLKNGDSVPIYDPGSLWRYLCLRLRDPRSGQLVGPFLEEWPQDQLKQYNDYRDLLGQPRSRYLVDPWDNPYGYVGNVKRVLHSPGSFDIFSAGPDGVTACNNGKDDDLLGQDHGDNYTDASSSPDPSSPMDNRAYNSEIGGSGRLVEKDDDGNGIPNDSLEFGPEAIRNGDIGDDINSWSSR